MIFWFDTCVWRDFYEGRVSKSGSPLGRYATDAFMKVIKNGDKILFSEVLVRELKRDYDENEITDMLNFLFLSDVLISVQINRDEYLEAVSLSKARNLPFVDCLIAIQARNNNAIVVSQDLHFTKDLIDIVKVIKPQEL